MKKIILIIFFTTFYMLAAFAQSDNAYQIEIRKAVKINTKTYEFEVYIKAPKLINISAYQLIFKFNEKILSGNDLTFEYIDGTSQMKNKPLVSQIVMSGTERLLSTASGPGFEQISKEVMIGKFRLKSKTEFVKKEKINPMWNFSGKINTIIMGTNSKDITTDFAFKPKVK